MGERREPGVSRPHQAIAAALLLAGCTSLYPPKSADEFRRAASASLLPKTGSLEVARPLPQVSDDLRKKSAECLDVSVTAVTKTITDFQEIIRTYYVTYKPTVVAAPERTELHVQWHTKGDIHLSRAPEGGADLYFTIRPGEEPEGFDFTAGCSQKTFLFEIKSDAQPIYPKLVHLGRTGGVDTVPFGVSRIPEPS